MMNFGKSLIVFVCLLFVATTATVANNLFISERIYRVLIEVENLIADGEYNQALSAIAVVSDRRTSLNAYEQALVHQVSGIIYAQLEDYTAAERNFELALQSKQLPDNLVQQTYYNLAQIYFFQEHYRQAVMLIEHQLLSSSKEPSPSLYFMLASAYAALDEIVQALQWSEKSLQTISAQTPESYFVLAINLYWILEQYRNAEAMLRRVLQRVPDKAVYWRQLAAVHLELENPQQALAALELGNLQGVLVEESDLLQMAKLYINLGVPHKAGYILAHGMKTGTIKADKEAYELLAAAWNNAREYQKAVAPLTNAAVLSEDGNLFLQLAYIYVADEDWNAALSAITQAVKKGGLAKPHEARFTQAVIYTNLGRNEDAEKIFFECLDFEGTRKRAIEWLKFLGHDA